MSTAVPYKQIPDGWYVIEASPALARKEVKRLRYFGRDLVLYRTEKGEAHLVDAYCPHLGAHLGDGKITGENLVCPFHAFEFDGAGHCVATPYAAKRLPPRAALENIPVREQSGLILAYHGAPDQAPAWEVPPLDMSGWRPFTFHDWTFRGHPQETSENSVDLGHFGIVHHYASANMIKPLTIEGPTLKSGYAVKRSLDWIGLPGATAELRFEADVYGLGYSLVRAGVDAVGIHARLLVLPTPIEVDKLHLRIACSIKETRVPGLAPLVHAIALRAYAHDVAQDVVIWRSKQFIAKPALADGDGPIAKYRKWTEQFYAGQRKHLTVIKDHQGSDAAE